MRISRTRFTYFLIVIAMALIVVLCVVAGCMPQARVTQIAGRAEVSREHTKVTISDVVPPPQDTKEVIHIRIVDCPKEPTHENAPVRPDAVRSPR